MTQQTTGNREKVDLYSVKCSRCTAQKNCESMSEAYEWSRIHRYHHHKEMLAQDVLIRSLDI